MHAQEPAKNGMRNVLGQVSLHHGNGFKYYVCMRLLPYTCSAELKAEPQMHGYYRGLLYSTALVPFQQFYR